MAVPRAVFNQLNVVSGDVGAAVAFYKLLGVDIAPTVPGWETFDAHHRNAMTTEGGAEFELDSTVFAPHFNAGWPAGRAGVIIGFRVLERADVDAAYVRLVEAGHRGMQPPFDAFWGARYAIVEDPDGNAVGVMSEMDRARRTAAPDPATF